MEEKAGRLSLPAFAVTKRRRLERIVRHVRSCGELRVAHAGKPICITKSGVVSAAWNPLWLLLCQPMRAVDLDLDLVADESVALGAMRAFNDDVREQELLRTSTAFPRKCDMRSSRV